jgi:hypothetical protein
LKHWIIKAESFQQLFQIPDRVMSRNFSFAQSFMWMSFATVGLMVASQMGAFSALTARASIPFSSASEAEHRSQLVVDLGDRKVYLYTNGDREAGYDIAVGKAGWETPAGDGGGQSVRQSVDWFLDGWDASDWVSWHQSDRFDWTGGVPRVYSDAGCGYSDAL